MNRRQKKKAFKKRFGFNPPRNIPIHTATCFMEIKENFFVIVKKIKNAIVNLCEMVKGVTLELAEELKKLTPEQRQKAIEDFKTKRLLQQESEVKQLEGNSNIYNNDRR